MSFSLSLAGAGRGLAAFVHGRCATAPEELSVSGPVLADALHAGVFGAPLALTGQAKRALQANAVALPGGGGTVSWASSIQSASGTTFTVAIGSSGAPGPVLSGMQIAGGLVPATIDGAGDQLLSSANWQGFPPGLQGGLLVRPAGGGADQPAPSAYGYVAAAAPLGRAFALAWNTSPSTLGLSVWRP